MKTWISITLLLTLCACATTVAQQVQLSNEFPPGSDFMQLKLLGTVMIPNAKLDGESISELSGLAWDEDEQTLYAVSDKGTLLHLKLRFDTRQQLSDVVVTHAYPLLNSKGKKLKGKKDDSEGLTITKGNNGKKSDSELLISFEGKPRIKRYAADGSRLGDVPVVKKLSKKQNYQSGNRGLEAVTLHPEHGVLTIPESPLKGSSSKYPTLYSADGKEWKLPARANKGSSIVGLETLADGSIMTLERIFNSLFEPVIIQLQLVKLDKNCEVKNNKVCDSNTLASFNSIMGWSVDNFEGLTHHQGQRYFMVSDDNDFWLQRTLLTYFEIKPGANLKKSP